MLIENAEIIYSAIYDAHSANDMPAKFFAGCKVNDKVAAILAEQGIFPSERTGLFSFNSIHRPRISARTAPINRNVVMNEGFGPDYMGIVQAIQIAEARNIGKNRLFMNVMADVKVKIHYVDTRDCVRPVANIIERFVSPSDLLRNATQDDRT
jgi:hypothetical protein